MNWDFPLKILTWALALSISVIFVAMALVIVHESVKVLVQ